MTPELRYHARPFSLRRAAILTVCLGAIALVASGYWAWKLRLPDPETADREGLVRWLVLRDLRGESPHLRATLLRRFQEETPEDVDPASIRSRLNGSRQERLWGNILVLAETWYSGRLDAYLAASPQDRPGCLDETIAEVTRWKMLASLQPDEGTDQTPPELRLLKMFAQQVAIWKEKASPQRRKQMTEFDAALRGRWMLHTLGLARSEH